MALVIETPESELIALQSGEPTKSVAALEKAAKEEAKEAKPEKVEKSDDDETPEWVTRLGVSPEQHAGITDVIKRSINKKHAQAKEAEEFATEQYKEKMLAEQRAGVLERELQSLREAQKPKEKGPPARDQFKSDIEFQDAVIDYKVEQKIKEQQAEDRKRAQEKAQAEMAEMASKRIQKAIELVPDFTEVTQNADMDVPTAVAGYMQESEMFAEIGYFLAKNPDALEALTKLSPARQLVEIGKIESKLQPFALAKVSNGAKPSEEDGTKPSPDTVNPSKPRSPVIRPLSTGSSAQVEKDESEMSYSEARAAWERKRKVNLTVRKRH